MGNTALNIRHKLFDYIRVADDKRLFAIYNILENEIKLTNKWWKDNQFLHELDNRYEALETGRDKGYTSSQIIQSIEKLRRKKYGK